MTEEVAEFSVSKEKSLSAFQASEASLLPFSIPGGAMRLFNQVVLALCS